MARTTKPTRRPSINLETEINATVDLIATHITPLTAQQREAANYYLSKLATVATTRTVLPKAEQEAIKQLCEEVLHLASDEPVGEIGDKLREMVRAITLGEQVFRARYEV